MLDNTILRNNIIDSASVAKNSGVLNQMKKETVSGRSFAEMLGNDIERSKEAEKRKLMEACHDMEAIFIAKMLKEMRKNVEKSEWLHGGFAQDIFEDMLYDEYSKQISKNSNMGLARMLYDEMSKKL